MGEISGDLARADDFNEADHPRAADGKFGSGGGSSSGSTKLTPTEKTHISSYTGDEFHKTNSGLRKGSEPSASVKSIDAAIAKSTLPAGTKLYRGMSRDAAKTMFPGGQINKGDVISDKAFLSTSRDKGLASFAYGLGGVVFEIETTEDQPGLDVAGLTRNPQEKEVLLPRNTKLKVSSIVPPKNPGEPVVIRVTTT